MCSSYLLRAFLLPQLARIKIPRLFDFRSALPREANGKLYKRELRDEYAARAQDAAGETIPSAAQ